MTKQHAKVYGYVFKKSDIRILHIASLNLSSQFITKQAKTKHGVDLEVVEIKDSPKIDYE